MNRTSALLGGAFVALTLAGCGGGSGKPGDKAGAADANTAPDFSLTADDFTREVKADSAAAVKKYKGKVVELTGTVNRFGKNLSGDVQLMLAANGDLLGVICFTADKRPWNQATYGQTVKVRGVFPDFVLAPALLNCVVTGATGPKAPALAAEEVGKAADSDPKALQAKHKDQWLVLTGTVAAKEEKDKAVRVTFKTDSKTKVVASFTPMDKADADHLAVGSMVRVVGEFNDIYANDGEVALGQCLDAGAEK